MLSRYKNDEIGDLWEAQTKWEAFLEVELLAAEAFCELGVIPREDIIKLRKNATFSLDRIEEIENETKHDVVAFTRCVSESLGDEKRWVHYGLTSTDVGDTAQGYILKQVNDILYDRLVSFSETLKDSAIKYENVPCIGRTHGVHADITSFGLKFALWYDEFNRHIKRFNEVRKEVEVGKISGAVGNFANTKPFVQDFVCEKLGIVSSNISTQTLQRDRHANYLSILALIATSIEKIAVEIRHLQRTEVREVEERFRPGQKGSSAMPHKRNPIASENMAGLARTIRGYMNTAFDNVTLWHERDISHSSAERIILPDSTILLEYMLKRYNNVLSNLVINEDRMIKNIYATNGVIFVQRVLTSLIDKGYAREKSYDLVQPIAMDSFNNDKNLMDLLMENDEVTSMLTSEEIQECFTLEYYLKEVNTIYKRVGIY